MEKNTGNVQVNDKPTALIVGGGLVGSLWALFLQKRGVPVTLIEKRKDPRGKSLSGGRSINLAISHRGIRALERVGLSEEVLRKSVAMRGRKIHDLDGSTQFQPYSPNPDQCIYSISRSKLNEVLLEEVTAMSRRSPTRLFFEHSLESIDFEKMAVQTKGPTGESVYFSRAQDGIEFIFGTDGAGSVVRSEIHRTFGLKQNFLEDPGFGYKEFQLPLNASGASCMDPNALHIWPRGEVMLIALPNEDGSFTCTLFYPNSKEVKKQGSLLSYDSKCPEYFEFFLEDSHKARLAFEALFPDTLSWFDTFAKELVENPTGHLVTSWTSPWNFRGSALLLGDSAHAILPFFGQGMNAGFEDCDLLDQLWDEEKSSENLFDRFFEMRKPDADAIAEMAIENFLEMRDRVRDHEFLKERALERVLMRRFPEEFLSRYSLVTFSSAPYRIAQKIGEENVRLLQEIKKNLPEGVLEVLLDQPMEEAHFKSALVQAGVKTLINDRLKPLVDDLKGWL